MNMTDSRFVMRVLGLGVATGLAWQPAQAGERMPAAIQAHHPGAASHRVVFVAPARSNFHADVPTTMRHDAISREIAGAPGGASRNTLVRGEFSFLPVTPLEARARSQMQLGKEGTNTSVDQPKEQRSTAPSERKTVRFFRLDPRLGDVSVQPVVGSVNGAQLSVGF